MEAKKGRFEILLCYLFDIQNFVFYGLAFDKIQANSNVLFFGFVFWLFTWL